MANKPSRTGALSKTKSRSKTGNRLAFISYSRADREFAVQLNASLTAVGVNTFLDLKDIDIGQSIPEEIYDGLSAASFLIAVVSTASVNSSWAKEELSVVKMRAMKSGGAAVLPVVIDDVTIPASLAHIKYGDFRQWRYPDSYRKSFHDLAVALGFEPTQLGNDDLSWYAENSGIIKKILRSLSHDCLVLDGGINTYYAGDHAPYGVYYLMKSAYFSFPRTTPPKDLTKAEHEKHLLEHRNERSGTASDALNLLISVLSRNKPLTERLTGLRTAAADALHYACANIRSKEDCRDINKATMCQRQLALVVYMLEELRSDIETVLISGFARY